MTLNSTFLYSNLDGSSKVSDNEEFSSTVSESEFSFIQSSNDTFNSESTVLLNQKSKFSDNEY